MKIRARLCSLCILFILLPALSLLAQTREASLKKRFLEEAFVDGKSKIAREIAALKTPAARSLLEELFESDDSWDSAGSFFGLLALSDPALDVKLAQRYVEDSSLQGFVKDALVGESARFLPHWKRLYAASSDDFERRDIIDIVGAGSGEETDAYLIQLVRAKSSLRIDALQAYASKRRKGDAVFVRALVADPELKVDALALLSGIGSPEDLALFEKEFFSSADPRIRLPALTAFSAWAGKELKTKAFAASLEDKDEALRESACLLFKDIRNPSLQAQASVVAEDPTAIYACLAAAEYLAGYKSPDIIPSCIHAFKAEYRNEERRIGFGDWLANVITLGLSSVLDQQSRSRSKSDFNARKSALAVSLSTIAKRKMGADYPEWELWCLSQGYSVASRNIIQELFSSDPDARATANSAAIRLLGFSTEASMQKYKPDYAGLDSYQKALYLAKALRDAGYPKGFR